MLIIPYDLSILTIDHDAKGYAYSSNVIRYAGVSLNGASAYRFKRVYYF